MIGGWYSATCVLIENQMISEVFWVIGTMRGKTRSLTLSTSALTVNGMYRDGEDTLRYP